jgi:hypothetical protein
MYKPFIVGWRSGPFSGRRFTMAQIRAAQAQGGLTVDARAQQLRGTDHETSCRKQPKYELGNGAAPCSR